MYLNILNGTGLPLTLEGDNPKPGGRVLTATPAKDAPPQLAQWLWLLWPESQGLALLNPAFGLYVTASPSGSTAVSTVDALTATPDQAFIWDTSANEGHVIRLAANDDRNLRVPDNASSGAAVLVDAWERGRPNELWNSQVIAPGSGVRPAALAFQVISHNNLAVSIGKQDRGLWDLVLAKPDADDPLQSWMWLSIPPTYEFGPTPTAVAAALYSPACDALVLSNMGSQLCAVPASRVQSMELASFGWQALASGCVRTVQDDDLNMTAGPKGKVGSPVQLLNEWDHGQPYELWTTSQLKPPTFNAIPAGWKPAKA